MTQILFKRFLEDKNVYRLSHRYWKKQLFKLSEKHHFSFSSYLNHGQEEYDENPIFDGYIPAINKGIRIIQAEPSSEPFEFSAWLDSIELGENQFIKELVIDLVLTRKTRDVALELIKVWLVDDPSIEKMAAHIDQLNTSIK